MDFNAVTDFENKLANFFNAPYCVTTDSCTHAIELCLRLDNIANAVSPTRTYISIPFTFEKLGINWWWENNPWEDYYYITRCIIDAAVFWKAKSYISNTMMCISFQFKKHLALGRGGCILLDDLEKYKKLKKMSYDGREKDVPWSKQNIKEIGYHYYMTPETASLGLNLLPQAIKKPPKKWNYLDYPNLVDMDVFK